MQLEYQKGHFNHAHSFFHNFMSGSNNGCYLLTFQHGAGDLASIGQDNQKGFVDMILIS